MSLLVTATLTCALSALFGGISMLRQPIEPVEPADGVDVPSSPLGRLKALVEAGAWQSAIPPLLVLGGILGVMLFGALSLIFVYDQPRSGWPMFVVAVLTIGWAAREYIREGEPN